MQKYQVVRLGGFGSVARGTSGEDSDVDIAVEMAPNLFFRAALREELQAILGCPVDVIRMSETMNPHLIERIVREVRYG